MAANTTHETLARTSYELSLGALGEQERVIAELRSRTGTLLAATSLAASFLGGRAIDTHHARWLTVLAAVAFVASILACLYVLVPKRALVFALRGGSTFEALYEVEDAEEVFRRLVYWLDEFRDGNQRTVDDMHNAFRIAAWALTAKVVLWGIEVFTR